MPVNIGSLVVSLNLDAASYATSLSRATRATSSATSSIRRDVGLTGNAVGALGRSMGSSNINPRGLLAASRGFEQLGDRVNLLRATLLATTGVFGGFTAALASNIILRYADSYTRLANQVRVVSDSATDLRARLAAIATTADDARAGLGQTATLYSRLQTAQPNLDPGQVLRYVGTIQKALALGGATAQEAASAAIQFSQAIASNRLGGDELRAVLETPLGLQLAKGLGVTIGKLREMSVAGQLTSSVVLGALGKIEDEVNSKFAKSVLTLDQSLVVLDNNFTVAIGHFNEAYGVTRTLSAGMLGLANNAGLVINAVAGIGGALAIAFAGRLVGGRIESVFTTIRNNAQQARNTVDVLTASVKNLQQEQLQASLAANRARRTAGADPLTVASPSSLNAYQQALRNIQQIDAARLVQQQRIADASKLSAQNANADLGTRIQLARALVAEQTKLLSLNQQHAAATTNASSLRGVASQSGQIVQRQGVTETASVLRAVNSELASTALRLTAAQRAATVMGQAFSYLRVGAASFISFLGGPWGAAITAATIALSILGARSAQTAQQIAEAQAIIGDRLGNLAEGGNKAAQQSLLQLKTSDLEKQKKVVDDYAISLKNLLTQQSYVPNARGAASALMDPFRVAKGEVMQLETSLLNGKMTLADFTARVKEIGQGPGLGPLSQTAIETTTNLVNARLALQGIQAEINKINASSGIDIKVNEDRATRAKPSDLGPNTTIDAVGQLRQELIVSQYKARGLTAEAKAQEVVNQARQQGNFVSMAAILPLTQQIVANDKLASSAKKAATEYEKTANIIDRIKRGGEAAFLGDVDRQVVDQTKNIQNATQKVREYIDAVKSGDMSKAPKELLQVRDALQQAAAGDAYRGIIEKYGEAADLAGEFADKQAQLNILVSQGNITADQASRAWTDFVTSFGQFEWVDQLGDAFSQFATSAVSDFDNINEAALNFAKQIANIVLQTFVLKPLLDSLKGSVLSAFGVGYTGGGAFPTSAPDAGGVYHTGGIVGQGASSYRSMAGGSWAGAPRYHSGLMPDEHKAILQRGEQVLTKEMGRRNSGTMAGLAALAANGNGGGGSQVVNIKNYSGAQVTSSKRQNGRTSITDIVVGELNNAIANGATDKSMGQRFGFQASKIRSSR